MFDRIVRNAGMSPRWARWLPATSRSFGPPRRFGFIREVVPAAGGTVTEIDPARPMPRPLPVIYGDAPEVGLGNFHPIAPPTCVFTLPTARLLGPEGYVVTRDDCFVYDASFLSRVHATPLPSHPLYRRKRSRPVRRLAGCCLSLATDFAAGSFGHFLHDGFSRLYLFAKAGIDPAQADWVFCPRPRGASAEALFRSLRMPPERVLNWSQEYDYEAERLVATCFPCEVGTITPEMARYLRDLASPWRAVGRSRERIFLTRGNLRRNLLNLAEIEGILREHGFSVIDPADHPATIEHCANAEIIAGVDGSNLANIAFAPEGACIMIFICATAAPPEPYNLTLATSGGRQLHILQGIFPRAESTRYNEGFVLPPERLRACLRAVCPAVP